MKKLIVAIIIAAFALVAVFGLTACEPNDESITIVVPDGAPALAIAKLINENATYEDYQITYKVVASASDVSTAILNGEASFALAPTNLCSVIYNKNQNVVLLSANIFGNLYMVGSKQITSLDELKGEVVYLIGQAGSPDLTLKYILSQKGIQYVESSEAVSGKVALTYVNSGSELIPMLKNKSAVFGVLGEPAVTQAIAKANVSNLFSLSELWSEVTNDASYTQASFIGNSNFVNGHPKFVKWLLQNLSENSAWVAQNPAAAVAALKTAGATTLPDTLSAATVAASNLGFVKAADAKSDINAYLSVIYGFNPAFVGGKLPDDGFYYAE